MIKNYPFYFKSTVILLGFILLVYALFNLREIMVPLAFSLLLAILLNPLANWFQRKKIPRILSIALSMLIALVVTVALLYFIASQIVSFGTELPLLKKKFVELFFKFQQVIQNSVGLPVQKQQQLLNNIKANLKPFIGSAIGTVLGSIAISILLPVYTFLFLFYKNLILNFLFEFFSDKNSNIVGILAILFPVIIATITKDGFNTQLGIIIAYIVIQFIDNHFLIPVIVSSRVRINALISIVIVLLGGELWGISGMFLSIPFIGVLKIVFDRIPEMRPWGKLLGDEIPTRRKGKRA